MPALFFQIVAAAFAVLAVGGLAYLVLTLFSLRRYAMRRTAAPDFTPPVSILKPLKGLDPAMYEAFRSHCLQDYPAFEIIFGVNDAADPAVAAVERLREELPERRTELVV